MRGLCDHCTHQGAAPSQESGRYSVLAYCVLLINKVRTDLYWEDYPPAPCTSSTTLLPVRPTVVLGSYLYCTPHSAHGQSYFKGIVHLTQLRVNYKYVRGPLTIGLPCCTPSPDCLYMPCPGFWHIHRCAVLLVHIKYSKIYTK